MALQIWLPLTGDLHNQGLNPMTFTNQNTSNIVVDNSGKIGKCYKRTTKNTAGRIISDSNINLNGDLSMCCWAKVIETPGDSANGLISNHSHADNTGFGICVKQVSTSDYRISCSTGNGSGRTYYTYYGTSNIKEAWHHLALTYNNTTHLFQLWVDGKVEKTQSYTNAAKNDKILIFDWSTTYDSTSYRPACMLNDVRIYDHCLSPKEVEEIAKGLVLHYKLDDRFCEATTNLITSISSGGQTTVSNNIVTTSGTNADTYFTLNLSENITNGTQYTIQCYAEMPVGTTWTFPIGAQSNSSLSWILKPGYNEYTFTANNISWGTKRIFMDDLSGSARSSGIQCKFYNFQLEKKNHATGFAGYGVTRSPTIIYDSSGYSNNGTIVGTLTAAAGSPRYDVCTQKSSGTYIRIDNRPTEITAKDAITVNMWVNFSIWGNPISCTEGGGWNFEESSGLRFPIYIASIGYKVAQSTVTSASLKNAWHMLTGTMDKDNVKLYIDGEEKGTIATGSTNGIGYINNYIFIGGEAQGNTTTPANSNYTGKISDVRIYATALTTEQVKELYNTSMSVDSNGNVYARELSEL